MGSRSGLLFMVLVWAFGYLPLRVWCTVVIACCFDEFVVLFASFAVLRLSMLCMSLRAVSITGYGVLLGCFPESLLRLAVTYCLFDCC